MCIEGMFSGKVGGGLGMDIFSWKLYSQTKLF